ncbi:hypothetical protein [Mycobacterium sp. 141]|uniref:hypothetical protein n=1 Tax=Mycobacterium sp. 141 TaxID=1120797 RepID=UPI00037AA689|nr:hypothetical protein [Mycobacterium sp. 141]
MINLVSVLDSQIFSVLDSQIFSAYQQVKKAQAESDYAAMIRWMLFVDQLLDRRGVTKQPGTIAVAGQAALT